MWRGTNRIISENIESHDRCGLLCSPHPTDCSGTKSIFSFQSTPLIALIVKQQYAYLEGIKIDAEAIRVVRLDQEAVEPEKPVKPKKFLVISIAILLGGMLGIFTAFIRNAVKKRKEGIGAVTA